MQGAIAVDPILDREKSAVTPALEDRPVTDVEAFLASLPRFTDEEVQALEAAILEAAICEDRAQRHSSLAGDL